MVRLLILGLIALGSREVSAAAVKTVLPLAPPLAFDRISNNDGLPNSDVRVIIQDHQGFIWFGTQDGLARYDGRTIRVYRPSESDVTSVSAGYITAITLDASGKLWVGTAEDGVNLYDPETDKFTRFKHGTTKGTLSSEGVTAIVRDSKDRIWFAMSGGGLDQFDPATSTFAEYLKGTAITALDADPSGVLWLGTADGVVRWNPADNSSSTFRLTGDGAATTPITALRVTSTKQVWIGSDGDGLFALEPGTRKVRAFRASATDASSISDDHITALFEDRNHELWIGTTNGLDRMDAKGKIARYHHDPNDIHSLAFPGIESIFQDAAGVMWIGGFTAGVCKFDALRLKFGHYRTRTHPANSYFEDPDGTLWVGTYNGGLYKFEWGPRTVTLYQGLGTRGEPGFIPLESSWITALHRDRQGSLWISLRGQGLVALDTKTETFRHLLPEPDKAGALPVDTIWDLWEDDAGMIWLASWGSGLIKLDPKADTFTQINGEESIGSSHLYTLYPDPTDKKTLWIGTAKGGLVRYNPTTNTGTPYRHKADNAESLSSDDVLSIYRDGTGSVWAGTYGGGLNRLDLATGKFERFTTQNSLLTSDVIWGVLPDASDKLWLSTNGGGLIQLDPKTKKILVYQASDGVQDNEFGQGSFMRSKSGMLFFGGVGGFNAFDPKDIAQDTYVPPVVMTGFKVFNQDVSLAKPIWNLPGIEVSYSDSFEVQFAALSFAAPGKNRYAYKLDGFDDKFIETDRPFATYTKLAGGSYTLRVRAANQHGTWNEAGIALEIAVTPPLWRTWPAFLVYFIVLAGAAFVLFRLQRQKVRRLERESRLAVVERDLALSGAVQGGFLPEYNEIDGALRLFGFYRAADSCSGDWWWHESSGGRHLIMVGDVTGHGPGPALVTAAVATAFRVVTANGLVEVEPLLDLLNRVVVNVAKGKYHMTMAALELDETTGRWVFHSAGSPPILSLDQQGKHKVHFCPGSPLGTEAGFETGRLEGTLGPLERLLIFTDGIPEITLPNGNVLGMRRFAQMYERTRPQNLRDSAHSIVHEVDGIQRGEPQADDWTFALLEWSGR